ncbi:MAG: hypothetical protein R3228_17520 [Halioglobus sp.]|nr:hypothetical protein [Halioglobus sp.]
MDEERGTHIHLGEHLLVAGPVVPGVPVHPPGQVAHAGGRHEGYQEIKIARQAGAYAGQVATETHAEQAHRTRAAAAQPGLELEYLVDCLVHCARQLQRVRDGEALPRQHRPRGAARAVIGQREQHDVQSLFKPVPRGQDPTVYRRPAHGEAVQDDDGRARLVFTVQPVFEQYPVAGARSRRNLWMGLVAAGHLASIDMGAGAPAPGRRQCSHLPRPGGAFHRGHKVEKRVRPRHEIRVEHFQDTAAQRIEVDIPRQQALFHHEAHGAHERTVDAGGERGNQRVDG